MSEMEDRANRLESILAEAVELESELERRAYVDWACGADEDLKRRVEELIENHLRAGGFLESPVPNFLGQACGATEPSVAERPGTVIASYELIEKIGEGGFGVVFMAEQRRPVRRKVALKVLKPGMDTRQVVARFEAERQALALMDHPGIARVFDGGEAPSGRPYFVMELVHGSPITDFCDANHLSIHERLELFVGVCEAVQHAHQKGVIHRDLKPSNIMVAMNNGVPGVKVIDFGIAKATGSPLTDITLFTQFAQMIGTPMYMSPEQAHMSGPDIDTRTDIYALGVLLYELLTGTTPFDGERLRSATFDEIRRIIREEEPPKPSIRLTTLGEVGTTTSMNRRIDSKQLVQLFRRELDWIVMKALEKDRKRRYESADAFAADIRRYLNDEPVHACPPTLGYQMRKFARRHKGPMVAASFVLLALVAGIIGTTAGLIDARHHARLARKAQSDESEARQRESKRAEAEANERRRAEIAEAEAKQKAKEAQSELDLSNAVQKFLMHDLLGQAATTAQADRKFQPNPNLTIREALDRAAAAVGDKFPDRPELEASIRVTIGDAYVNIGQYDKGIDQLQQAVNICAQIMGADHLNTLRVIHSLAVAHREARGTTEAIKLYELVRRGQEKQLGPEHPLTLTTLHNLATAYLDAGRTNEALAMFEHVRDTRNRIHGADDPALLVTLHNIATMYLAAGRTDEAIAQLQQVLDAKMKLLGPEHPDTLHTLNNLATAYWKSKQLDKSIPLYEKLLSVNRRLLGEENPATIGVMANLGVNYRDDGRLAESIELLEQAHRDGAKFESMRWVGRELMIAYMRAEKYDQAIPFALAALADARKNLPEGSSQLAGVLAQHGEGLLQLKGFAEAEKALRECLAIRRQQAPNDWRTFYTMLILGESLLAQGKLADAEPYLLQGHEGIAECEPTISTNFKARWIIRLERIIQLYEDSGKAEQAADWRNKLQAAQSK